MEDISGDLSPASFVGSLGPDVAANLLTVVGLGLLWSLKKLCSRDSKCKTKCHLPCLDVEVADRTQRSTCPPSVPVDRQTETEV